jgi:putative redox protein
MAHTDIRQPIVITHDHGLAFSAKVRLHTVAMDQPVTSGGTDDAPTPLELLGAALGGCIALYAHRFLDSRDLPHDGLRVEVEQKSAKNPSRIAEFIATVTLPESLPEHEADMLSRVVRSCPAHHTLTMGADVAVDIVTPALAW